ncbi:MAG: CDP-alcohol phosphatidyltransferase family protein [Deltaproteobacteria bacterium]|nr:CDP-alcohol phosphatidyltransferase family protein [Deltaproteobacteria bacterium]
MQLPFPLKSMDLSPRERSTIEGILSAPSLGIIARRLNKKISLPASVYLARWGVAPNYITFFNLLIGLLSAYLASLGGFWPLFWGGVLFQLASIVDGCDGEVAKLTGQMSRMGSWFDTITDNVTLLLFIIGVSFGYYHSTEAAWVILALKLSVGSLFLTFLVAMSHMVFKKWEKASLVNYEQEVLTPMARSLGRPFFLLVSYGKYIVKKDFFTLVFCMLAMLALPEVIIFLVAFCGSLVSGIFIFLALKQIIFGSKPLETKLEKLETKTDVS